MATVSTLDDRRSIYRVVPDIEDHLQVGLLVDGQYVPASAVVDVTAEGISARFPARRLRGLVSGSDAVLRIESPLLEQAAVLTVLTVSVMQLDDLCIASFRFESLWTSISPESAEFFALFNRRELLRNGRPDVDQPVAVKLSVHAPDGRIVDYSAWLQNISPRGVGLCLDTTDDVLTPDTRRVDLQVYLNSGRQVLELVGSVCYSEQQEQRICYGMQIDSEQTPDYMGKAETILDYLARQAGGQTHEALQ